MNKIEENLLNISKKIVKEGIKLLYQKKLVKYNLKHKINKEFKSGIDLELNNYIYKKLKKYGFKIFSEESRKFDISKEKDYVWIVDPVDGTFNYVRNINSCAISLALYKENKIIFGVVGLYPSMDIYFGGKKYGAYKNNKKIQLSKTKIYRNAVLATGFPANSKFTPLYKKNFFNIIKKFAKIRMIGSAASSLVFLADGFIDQYYEQNIKLWDVAGGLAICEGVGAKIKLDKIDKNYSYNLKVSNKFLSI